MMEEVEGRGQEELEEGGIELGKLLEGEGREWRGGRGVLRNSEVR